MTKYLNKQFSVGPIHTEQFRDNWDAIFGCKSELTYGDNTYQCQLKRNHDGQHVCGELNWEEG